MLDPAHLKGKKVIVRADLDVPVINGRVGNSFRLEAGLPTLKLCLENAAHTLVIGHLGRPKRENKLFSLTPVQKWLKNALNQDIRLIPSGFSPGEWWTGGNPLSLLENIRFFPGENKVDRGFAAQISTGADLYIYDAFASYHPSASMQIIPELVPTVTGFQFDREVATLSKVIHNPAHPTLLLASGAKQDKLDMINKLAIKFDQTLLGGVFARQAYRTPDNLDLNQDGIDLFLSGIAKANTIVMNGPLGKYEDGIHNKATKAVFEALKGSSAFTILGGGDTLAAISALGFKYSDFGFVSTGGGAMLEFLATGTHPLLSVLRQTEK